jgi:hypothetical protein
LVTKNAVFMRSVAFRKRLFTQKKERGFSKKVSLSFLENITIKILFNSVHNKHSHHACGRNAYRGYNPVPAAPSD